MGTTNFDTVELKDGLVVSAGSTVITKIKKYTPSLSPASVAANTTAEQSFAVTGLAASDIVVVNKPTAQAGLGIVGARAEADLLYITFSNNTAGAITPTAAETYQVLAFRS